MSKHWTEIIFVEKPTLFGASLERVIEQANIEVAGVEEIFSQHGVSGNSLILDLCCGIGRHSVVLAMRGFRVVGVDLSPKFIARAKELAAERKACENVEFKVGDIREIGKLLKEYRGKFNAVINLVTSIGYYDEETDKNVFTQLLDLTASNGVLVIDLANRDWITRHFLARDISYPSDDLVLIQERKLKLEDSRMENVWKYYRKKGNDLKFVDAFEVNHRVYSLHELKGLVEAGGWAYQTCYGNFNLGPFTMDSNRIILVAKKM